MEKKRILVAEDERSVARDIQQRLSALGYDASTWVTSGAAALGAAAKAKPDLVLVDAGLEGEVDGVQAGQEIGRRHQIPVVYLTDRTDAVALEHTKLTGLFGYIHKPFDDWDLEVAVELALLRHGNETEHAEHERRVSAAVDPFSDGSGGGGAMAVHSSAPIASVSRAGGMVVLSDLPAPRPTEERLGRLLELLQSANRELTEERSFLSALLAALPAAVLVVDTEGRVRQANRSLEAELGALAGQLSRQSLSDVLRCHEAGERQACCGSMDICQACQVLGLVQEAHAGRHVHRRRAELRVRDRGGVRSKVLMVSASPLDYRGERMALLVLEDLNELNGLRALVRGESGFSGIVGRDARMVEVFETIREVADVSCPVLIQGESGTGKELVARAIHNLSPRAARNFVAVSCCSLPEGLLESELFGHVKGAFTGAVRDGKGRFELADGGTIFLDEVGELPAAMQVKLLRVLQEQAFERIGGVTTLKVDVRVISATNRDLRQEVAAGRFREDLFYRLCVVPIDLPPLRKRISDLPLLAESILERAAATKGTPPVGLSPRAMAVLMEHSWPGNVRELQNALEFALIKSRGEWIEPAHLPPSLRWPDDRSLVKRRRDTRLTADAVAAALQAANGNKLLAARSLGVSRSTLYRYFESGPGGGA